MTRDLRAGGLLVLLLLAAASAGRAAAPACPDSAALMSRVRILCAPELAGRGGGSPGARAAGDSVAGWLAAAGLTPAFAGSWFQEFPLEGAEGAGGTCRNVAGILPGRGALAERWLVVGAHYDHLGRVEPGTDDVPARGAYYPGANDNASGVTALVELARLAAAGGAPDRRSCLFVSFGAEEIGLQGSAHLARNLPLPRERLDAMLNLDCVGRPEEGRLYVGGVGTAAIFADLLAGAEADGLDLVLSPGGWAGSDHVVFNSREVPVLFFFTGPYPQYNRPEDDWGILDVPGLVRVTAFGARVLEELLAWPEPLAYRAVAEAELRPPAGDAPERRAWLGSIPDFAAEDSVGVRLAGVIDGSPAQRAGLARGDLLLSLDGRPVADLAGLTTILRDCRPGQTVALRVLREGRPLDYLLVLADRRDRR